LTEQLFSDDGAAEGTDLVPSFARHETFHPRFGWLKKGFDAASEDPTIFLQAEAMTRLGVGKNMVRSIRFWCNAYKVLDESRNPDNTRLRDAHPTEFGSQLLADDGWDPYLEDPASLWLLHWQLLRPRCSAPAWYAIFNTLRTNEFTDESLVMQLRLFCETHPEWGEIADNSLLKDARCLLRMYASVTSGRDLIEDSIDSPFVELDLIRPLRGARGHFLLNTASKQTLAPAVVAYACVDFARLRRDTSRVVTLSRLTHSPGSPGRVFQLSEAALLETLERAVSGQHALRMTQAAGTKQLIIDEPIMVRPVALLEEHYGTRALRGASGPKKAQRKQAVAA
jgi:hypothetical protein